MFFYKICQRILLFLSIQYTCLVNGDVNNYLQTFIDTSIDHNVEPCDDFYAYACGNYAEQHRSKYYQEITTQMDYKYNRFILNLLESLYQHDHQVPDKCQSFVEKARVYLKSCVGVKKRDVKKYFEYIKPGPQLNWPLWLDTNESRSLWPERNFNVWKLLGEFQSYGLNNVLINQIVLVDREGKLQIKMEPAYANGNNTLLEVQILKFVLMALEAKRPKEDLRNLMKTNKKLIEIYKNYDIILDEMDLNLKDLKLQFPNLDLEIFIKELVQRDLPAETLVTLRNPDYFQYLNDEFEKIFKPIEFCNYLMLKFLTYLAKDGTNEFESVACVQDLRNKMDLAVNYLYYHHEYTTKAELYNASIEEIMNNIITQYEQLFYKNNLNLTFEQLSFLMVKLHNMRLNIGNLPQNVSFEMVEKFYENLPPLDKNNYYKNHLLLLKNRFNNSLVHEQNQTHFIVYDNTQGSSSGAFYVAKQNMIILPFGSLTLPMFHAHSHDVYKYSLLAFILAHEFTHAFETSGLYYNAWGDSLSSQDSDILNNENFQKSLQCLQSQLPTESIDERIADIVGIDLVYNAFYRKNNNNSNRNTNRNFYLNLAQFFCGKNNLKFIDHDTDAERLHQIVMNSPGFAEAFECPRNSKMNPIKRCFVY